MTGTEGWGYERLDGWVEGRVDVEPRRGTAQGGTMHRPSKTPNAQPPNVRTPNVHTPNVQASNVHHSNGPYSFRSVVAGSMRVAR